MMFTFSITVNYLKGTTIHQKVSFECYVVVSRHNSFHVIFDAGRLPSLFSGTTCHSQLQFALRARKSH